MLRNKFTKLLTFLLQFFTVELGPKKKNQEKITTMKRQEEVKEIEITENAIFLSSIEKQRFFNIIIMMAMMMIQRRRWTKGRERKEIKLR